MPNNIIKSFAEKSGKSIEEVEALWDKAKRITDKEYIKKDGQNDDRYYSIVTGIVKKMLKIEESTIEKFSKYLIMEDIKKSKLDVYLYKRTKDKTRELYDLDYNGDKISKKIINDIQIFISNFNADKDDKKEFIKTFNNKFKKYFGIIEFWDEDKQLKESSNIYKSDKIKELYELNKNRIGQRVLTIYGKEINDSMVLNGKIYAMEDGVNITLEVLNIVENTSTIVNIPKEAIKNLKKFI